MSEGLRLRISAAYFYHQPEWLRGIELDLAFAIAREFGRSGVGVAVGAYYFLEVALLVCCVRALPFRLFSGHSRRAYRRARGILGLVELLLPKRLREEDLGDALEVMDRLECHGAPRWQVVLKVASMVFWLSVKAIREVASSLLGKKSGG
ncbi:MAG TPA: hypothetical protein VK524_01240 [Polyangiaceae bacterium]|nr:hypothetical protein [Polyangiaceae bacterium]